MTLARLLLVTLVGFLIWALFAIIVVQIVQADPRVVTLTNGDDVYHANKSQRGAQTILALAGDDRVWSGVGNDTTYGGPGADRLHNVQAASGTIYGGAGHDVCVVGVKPGGSTNVEVHGCEKIIYRASQGHG